MSEKENLIVKYARIYENNLKELNYDQNKIEKKLIEWIKNALQYNKEHPDYAEKELENYLVENYMILR